MTLRPYQQEAVTKMVWARRLEGNDLISLPTGSGKSLVISELAKELKEPILILVPSKELLEQDKAKLEHWTKVNVYSAGMNEKTIGDITIATIQSAYKNPELFKDFKVVIIDEADELNPKKLEGMYNKFFEEMGNPKIYGLTATAFRMDSYFKRWGMQKWQLDTIHTLKVLTRYQERFWSRMLYVVHAQDLIDRNYLVKLKYHKVNLMTQDKMAFNKSKSEFDLEKFEEDFNPFLKTTAEIVESMEKQVLVFCATVTQANHLASYLKHAVVVSAKTPAGQRADIVQEFRDGTLKVVINVGVLLVGFDKPDLENIVICRPTRSMRLHMQLLGRGMRTFPGKKFCNVYDFVGNVDVLGTAESMRLDKRLGKWDIYTDTFTDGMHYKELYTHRLKAPKTAEDTPAHY